LEDKEDAIAQIMKRKEDHINICLQRPVEARHARTLFDDVHLINNSLPEMDFDEIDTSTKFLGHKFAAPLMVGAMTGGAELAKKMNRNIAEACQELGLGMVVGSQRAGLVDKVLRETYSVAREVAPDIFIGSNIGGAQVSKGIADKDAKELIDMLDADAFYIHLNPAQEIVQPEGDTSYKDVVPQIASLVEQVGKPVVVKEVGSGISGDVARRLEDAGVSAIEVAGVGGTSYAAIEKYRAEEHGMTMKAKMGDLLWDWGIPTAASLYSVGKSVKIPVVSSGGLRDGLDVAKSMAIGASLCATALPILKPASISSAKVKETLEEFIYGLKCAMFLTGSKNVNALMGARHIITGELKDWVKSV
jgi:isopentenyl-diphosphate delta-isomerase